MVMMERVTGRLPSLVSVQKADVTATGSREMRTSPAARLGLPGRISFPKNSANRDDAVTDDEHESQSLPQAGHLAKICKAAAQGHGEHGHSQEHVDTWPHPRKYAWEYQPQDHGTDY